MFRFAHPYAFFLLVPLALAAWFIYRRRVTRGLLFAPMARIDARSATWHRFARSAAPVLFLAAGALAIVALARPQTVLAHVNREANAVAIQMVLDCSGSMRALDFSTRDAYRSRLDVVKETFATFVEARQDDLIGLITFGGFVSSRVPLTIDHRALLQSLKTVDIPKDAFDDKTGQMLNEEELLTAVGDALASACGRLEHAPVKSRIAVLLSDGESNTGVVRDPREAARAAKALGIRVYTIGVGSTGRAPFMARDPFGRNVVQYGDVRLDEDMLRGVADATGGKYFNVRDPRGLQRAMDDINKLEKTRIRRDVFEQYNEFFPYLLAPATALLAVAAALGLSLSKGVV